MILRLRQLQPLSLPLLLSSQLLLTGCGAPEKPVPLEGMPAELSELVEEDWSFRLQHDPLLATTMGRREGLERLPSVDDSARSSMLAHSEQLLERLRALDPATLDSAARTTFEVLERLVAERMEEQRFGGWQIPLNSDSGFHTSIARLPQDVPLDTLADHEAYIARLHDVPRYFSEQIANMRAGLGRGMTLSRVILDGYEEMAGAHADVELEESVFWAPFANLPDSLSEAERTRLLEQGAAGVRAAIGAYGELRDFLAEEYIPMARPTVGALHLPGGRAYYEYLVRHFTTLDMTPEEVHATGLAEVARIRAAMEAIIEEVGFEGSFADFLDHLRTDEAFYARTGEELLERASRICKLMDAKLPSLFTRLPRQPYGVEPVPDSIAPRYTGGRYVPASLDSLRAGTYWVNTYNLPSRPLYVLEALSLHEAVPGHHLQIALAAELEELPEFQNELYISAFGEGWALYCEALGKEVGFYEDPYSDFGRLTYEMWLSLIHI